MNYTIEELQDRIKTIANLPTLPHIASKLMRIVNSPTTSADTVASLVSQDVSLSAKVLRLANSAFYGVPKSINTLNNAVIILGFKIIQTMVLSLTVFDMFVGEDDEGAVFDRDEFWHHSLKCGVISRLLAHKRKRGLAIDSEEAFCAGLLHDVGKVVMEQYLNADLRRALRYAKDNNISGFEAERAVLGYTHCDVASWLVGTWSLPDEIEQPLVYHHEPYEATVRADAVMICHLADIISKVDENDADARAKVIADISSKAQTITLSVRDLEEIFEDIATEMERASVFISL